MMNIKIKAAGFIAQQADEPSGVYYYIYASEVETWKLMRFEQPVRFDQVEPLIKKMNEVGEIDPKYWSYC